MNVGLKAGAVVGAVVGALADDTGSSGTTSTTTTIAITDNGPVMTLAALVLSVVATTTGSAAATSVTVTVTLDASLTYVSSSGSGWACSSVGQVVTCTRATMAHGAAPTITINVTTGNATATASTSATCAASNASTSTATPDAASVLLVSKDATSGIRVPASATEWTHVMTIAGLATGNPSALWLMQEASGDLADSIGAFTLVSNGHAGGSYQQAVSGWTRTATTTTDNSTLDFACSDSGLPDISTTSALFLAYVNLPASFGATERSIVTLGGAYGSQIAGESAPSSNPAKVALAQNGVTSQAAATATTGVHPLVVQVNVTAGVPYVFTDADKITNTLGAHVGKGSVIGGNNASTWAAPSAGFLYGVEFFGAAAEMSNAQIKTLLTTLGWTVAWS